MESGFVELGEGVHVLPSDAERALVNIGLIVGSRHALLVDTGCGPRHAAQILAAVRSITALPLVLVNTHAHWDHFFGNAYLRRALDPDNPAVWAHAAAARAMALTGEAQRSEVAGPEPEMSSGHGPGTELFLPTHFVSEKAVRLDLGGVCVELFSLGRGHTDGDLMVAVPGVLFAGDVLEEGAPPQFDDAFPAEWVAVLRELAAMDYPVMVPGHGKPVDAAFAAALADTIEALELKP